MFNLTYITSYLKLFMTDVLGINGGKVALMFIITRLWVNMMITAETSAFTRIRVDSQNILALK